MKRKLLFPLLFLWSTQALAHAEPPACTAPPEPPPKPQVAHEEVTYQTSPLELRGLVYWPGKEKPTRPMPMVIFNHGSETVTGRALYLAKLYTDRGYVFFVPLREGHSFKESSVASAGVPIADAQAAVRGKPELAATVLSLHERDAGDVTAAIAWAKRQPFVDGQRLVVTGVSYGGIQTLLAAERCQGVRAFVSFAPGAMSWRMIPLRERLATAVKSAVRPIMIVQSAGDYSTGPSEVLGPLLEAKHGLDKAHVYPRFGCTEQDGHGKFATQPAGFAMWQDEVFAFIDAAFARPAPACPVASPK